MMRCAACGKTYDDSWKVCLKCGGELTAGGSPSANLTEGEDLTRYSKINLAYLKTARARLKRDWWVYLAALVLPVLSLVGMNAKSNPIIPILSIALLGAVIVMFFVFRVMIVSRIAFTRNAMGDEAVLHALGAIFVPMGLLIMSLLTLSASKKCINKMNQHSISGSSEPPQISAGLKLLLGVIWVITFSLMAVLGSAILTTVNSRNQTPGATDNTTPAASSPARPA